MSNETMQLINQAKSQARSECLKNFLAKNGKNLTRFAAIILVAGVGFFAFKYYQKSQQAKYSEILHKSLLNQQIGNLEEAKKNLQEIYEAKSAPSGVRSLASLRYAALLLNEGKKAESAKIYFEVSGCGSCDAYIKDLAGLLAVRTWLSDESEMKKEDLAARIEKIENGGKLLRYHVAEQRALLEFHKNNLEKSYQIFDSIAKNPESSPILKARANDGLKMIAAKGYAPKAEAKIEAETKAGAAEKSEEKK